MLNDLAEAKRRRTEKNQPRLVFFGLLLGFVLFCLFAILFCFVYVWLLFLALRRLQVFVSGPALARRFGPSLH